MAAPFSKIDFILILNFMENELKSKDEIIEALKKYKQYSQSSETKYGKIGPGRSSSRSPAAATDTSPEKKNLSNEEENGDYGIDPLAKLNKLIESHKIITDGLRSRLADVSDLCEEVSEAMVSENLKKVRCEDESPLDKLAFDVHSLNRQLEDLRQESRSNAMRLQETRELERLSRSTRRGHAVLVKLVSGRAKLGSEIKSKCQEVNSLEEGLKAAKLRSRQLEEKLLQLVEGVCNPSNQRKRMKADDMSKEMNRLLMKVKLIEEQNSRLSSKVTDIGNRHPHLHHNHHLRQQYQHHFHHLPQQIKLSDKDCSLPSTSPLLRPTSAVGSNPDPSTSLTLRSPLHQQPLQGPYLSSTAIQILQLREADKAVQKNPQQAQTSQGHSIPAYPPLISCNNAAPHSLKETVKSPARPDPRSALAPSSILQIRGSPSRDQPSKVINVNIVAGGRLNIAKESETTHFKIADEDHSSRQKQFRLPSATASVASSVPLRWPNPEASQIGAGSHFQHSEGRAASIQQQKQQHLQSPKPGRFSSARSAAVTSGTTISSPSVGLQNRSQKVNQILSTFKPSATQSSTTSS